MSHRVSPGLPHFITTTVVGWIDLFTRKEYSQIVVDSLKFCMERKGLEVFAYVIMPSHLHAIVRAEEGMRLPDILRDFKSFTARKIFELISKIPESRRDWLLNRFRFEGKKDVHNVEYKIWQPGYAPITLETDAFIRQKLFYIHNNPVKAMIVTEPEAYVFSSAIDYAGGKGLLPVKLLDM